jgi:uncharacterized OB-fold protein
VSETKRTKAVAGETVRYDDERVVLTQRYIDALVELMAAECEMMRAHEPDMAACWVAGMCEIGDLSTIGSVTTSFSSAEDKEHDEPEPFAVFVVEEEDDS